MITVKDLTFTYPGNTAPTLKGLTFAIPRGEIFGFLGPNGAGKTTTQKILFGILKTYQGTVRVMDRELRTLKQDVYEHIGIAFEFPNLYTKFTALENLNYFRKLYNGDTEDPMTLLQMAGLEKDARTRVADYSKGMKMRLNFCRSLLNKPDLLFLDEPSSGLDPVNLRRMKEIVLAQRDLGRTVCITTHNMHVAESLCDRVAFIVEGKIALIDSPRRLKIDHGSRKVRVEYRRDQRVVTRDFPLAGIGDNPDFHALLKAQDIETIHTQEATLEDIFIETTGRSLA